MNRAELLKIAKPIFFNTEMTQAILDNRKSATRRVVKPQPDEKHQFPLGFVVDSTDNKNIGSYGWGVDEYGGHIQYAKIPYKVGDYLYVRETWNFITCDKCMESEMHKDFSPGCDIHEKRKNYHKGKYGCFIYRTNYGNTEDDSFPPTMFQWHPSIHMPKEASRIFLRVTAVKVKRLQEMCVADCIHEGVEVGNAWTVNAKPNFIKLWDSTINKQNLYKYGWNANPWVIVVEFERMVAE